MTMREKNADLLYANRWFNDISVAWDGTEQLPPIPGPSALIRKPPGHLNCFGFPWKNYDFFSLNLLIDSRKREWYFWPHNVLVSSKFAFAPSCHISARHFECSVVGIVWWLLRMQSAMPRCYHRFQSCSGGHRSSTISMQPAQCDLALLWPDSPMICPNGFARSPDSWLWNCATFCHRTTSFGSCEYFHKSNHVHPNADESAWNFSMAMCLFVSAQVWAFRLVCLQCRCKNYLKYRFEQPKHLPTKTNQNTFVHIIVVVLVAVSIEFWLTRSFVINACARIVAVVAMGRLGRRSWRGWRLANFFQMNVLILSARECEWICMWKSNRTLDWVVYQRYVQKFSFNYSERIHLKYIDEIIFTKWHVEIRHIVAANDVVLKAKRTNKRCIQINWAQIVRKQKNVFTESISEKNNNKKLASDCFLPSDWSMSMRT